MKPICHRRARVGRWQGRTWTLLAAITVLLAAGCANGQGSGRTTPTSSPTPTAQGAAATSRPAAADATGPRRIIVVVEENHSFDQIIGSPQAPFLNRLAGQGTLLTSFFAITHPSLPNYLSMLSGDTQGITSDCGGCNVDTANLVDQLERAGISWKAYMEDLPAPCSDARQAGPYAKKHDPFMYFASIRDDPGRCAKVVPASQLDVDLGAGRLPRFVFVTPNQDHDMHGAGQGGDDAALIRTADDWLQALYRKLAGSSAWRDDTRLVVTWDEGASGSGPTGCCGGLAAGGHVPTIVVGPRVPAGRDPTPYDHYGLLRSIEAAFGLPFLGHAADPGAAAVPAIAR
jgi:phosphatidylinositol-3-phosphatase